MQASEIEELYNTVSHAVQDLDKGNLQLQKASEATVSSRIFMLVFLLVASFVLLFLHWCPDPTFPTSSTPACKHSVSGGREERVIFDSGDCRAANARMCSRCVFRPGIWIERGDARERRATRGKSSFRRTARWGSGACNGHGGGKAPSLFFPLPAPVFFWIEGLTISLI